jgi:hypothetical protein
MKAGVQQVKVHPSHLQRIRDFGRLEGYRRVDGGAINVDCTTRSISRPGLAGGRLLVHPSGRENSPIEFIKNAFPGCVTVRQSIRMQVKWWAIADIWRNPKRFTGRSNQLEVENEFNHFQGA